MKFRYTYKEKVMKLSLRQLEVFRLLMRVRNVTDTARVLRISQPAVSAGIKELEAQFGIPLFLRSGGRLRPTPEAGLLLPEVERLFLQLSALHSRAREFVDAQAGSLSITGIPTLMGQLLPRAVARFKAERPRTHIELVGHPTSEVTSRIMQETMDVGFAYLPIHEPGVAIEPLFKTELVCLMHPNHRLADRPSLDAQDLADETLLTQMSYTPPGLALRESFTGGAMSLAGMVETNLSVAMASLVREGLGIGIIDPMVLCSPIGRDLVARPYLPKTTMTLAAIYSRHRPVSRAVIRFVAVVSKGLDEIVEELTARGLYGERLQ
jgi:DNA-binding transcriptional LysR family regulator